MNIIHATGTQCQAIGIGENIGECTRAVLASSARSKTPMKQHEELLMIMMQLWDLETIGLFPEERQGQVITTHWHIEFR